MILTLIIAVGLAASAAVYVFLGDLNHALAFMGLSLLADGVYELERIRKGRRG